MSELSRDTTEDGFHEIQLSGKQLVFLFIVTTSVVVGVFLFGVLVGRGAREPRANDALSSTSAPPEASPIADPAPPAGDPPPVALETDEDDDAQPIPPSISEGSAPPPATPAASPEPAGNAPAPASVASRSDRASDLPESGTPGIWLVQVIATREQADAASVAKRLEAKGYPAFLVSPSPGARQPFYKVQVGRYKDRSEAEQVSQRIKKEEKFQSWILR